MSDSSAGPSAGWDDLDLPVSRVWGLWMVAAVLGQAGALLLTLAIVGALRLDPVAATALVYLPLLVTLVAFS